MKKETQLSNEIKKLQYQLSYSEHISNYHLIQTRKWLITYLYYTKKQD